MSGTGDHRGILYPARLPKFERVPAPAELAHLVRWFWVPSWDLEPGRVSRQQVLPFVASNLVIDPNGVQLNGPTTGVSYRDLAGRGWAVGALLRPAAAACLGYRPSDLVDESVEYSAAAAGVLHAQVMRVMEDSAGITRPEASPAGDRFASHEVPADSAELALAAAEVFAAWLTANSSPPDAAATLANKLEELVSSDRTITRVDQLAERLALSTRQLQRIAKRFFGLPPLAIIRRYRLQEASQRLREDPAGGIGQIAADLGYTDQAHLAADFRKILGFTPQTYRRTQ